MEQYYKPASDSPVDARTPVRIVEFNIQAPTTESKPGLKHVKVFATFFPKDAYSFGKQFWQHTGEIVSSRQAAHCLRWLSLKAEEEQQEAAMLIGGNKGSTSVRLSRGNRHYSAAKAATLASTRDINSVVTAVQLSELKEGEEDKPIEEADGLDTQDYDVYVEERYGRNLDLSFAPKAKVALQRRIASQVSHHAGPSWTGSGEYVTEKDVYLYPTGMSAIYNAHRAALTLFPERKSICFGFPYTDTLKVLQKFGPGCYFYGHGEDADIETMEKEILEHTIGENVAEKDRILAVVCEFPSNPLLKSSNLVRLGELAEKYGFLVIVDETLGNFVNCRILEFADILVSSLSKIFSGDSNVMGGR